MVLGAGSCADIPLEQLAQRFRVVLVDIDLSSMQVAKQRLPEELRDNVILEVRDLSGNVVVSHSQAIHDIVNRSRSVEQAMLRLELLFGEVAR